MSGTTRIDRAVAALVDLAARRPWAALGLLGLLAALSIWGALGLKIDTDSSRMLARDLAFQQRAEALNRSFPGLKNNLVVVLRGDRAAAVDAATRALVDRLAQAPDLGAVFAPSADPFFRRNGALYQDTQVLSDQLSRLSRASNLIAALRGAPSLDGFLATLGQAAALARAGGWEPGLLAPIYAQAAAILTDPGAAPPLDWAGALGTGGGQATRVITLVPRLDFHAINPARAAIGAVNDAIAALGPTPGVEIGLTGDPALRAEELAQVREGLGIGQLTSLLLVGALFWLALRSVGRSLLGMGALVLSVVMTAGFAAAALGTLNLISVAFVVIMIGMGVEYALHFLAHLVERPGVAARAALHHTGQGIGGALVLSAGTTAFAFLVFTTTDFIGMAQLGLIGGFGVLIACAVSLVLIGAVVSLRPGLAVGTGAAARVPRREPSWAAPLALVLGLAGLAVSPWARFDADPMGLRDPQARSVQVYHWLAADPRTQPMRLSLLVPDAAAAEQAAGALRALPQVAQAVWLGDLIPKDQDAKLALIDLAYPSLQNALEGAPLTLPPADLAAELAQTQGAEAAALARALALPRDAARDQAVSAKLFAEFPALLDRLGDLGQAAEVTLADLPPALVQRYQAPDGTLRVEITPGGDTQNPGVLADFVAAARGVAPGVAGPPDQIVGAAGAVGGAMVQAGGMILAGSALLCWLMIGRLWPVLAILAPLGLAAGVTLGVSVLCDLPFNFANIIVLPLMIGIGIDGGVHMALRGAAPQSNATQRAILFSALTSIAAFGSLALSPHPGTASMGIMLTVALSAAMLMIFALTPAILRLEGRWRREPAPPA